MKNKQAKKLFDCLEIKNETLTSADLYFYGDIVSDFWNAWQDEDQYPEAVKNFLSGQAGKALNIYINSGGGSVFAGIAIYNMIKRFGQTNAVQVYVDGLAGSIASIIAFSGTTAPKIPANAFLMIHNPWASVDGNADELRKIADDLDVVASGMLSIYMEHVKEGVTEEQIRQLMAAETWLTGQQAAEYFNVEVTNAVEIAAASGDYVNRLHNIPKDLHIRKAESSEDLDARNSEQIQNKRDQISRIIINSL